jgi:hypothetical protein
MSRDLNQIAHRLRHEAGLLNEEGLLLRKPVDVERIAEHRGLRIVGAEPRGHLRLPRWRKGEIRINRRLLLVRAELLDEGDKECQLFEVIAHEVSHDALHSCHATQRPLPFGSFDKRRLALGRMSFGSSARDVFEREAIYLGALLQVPLREMRAIISPHVRSYAAGDWTFATSGTEKLERTAAAMYSRRSISGLAESLSVTPRTAKFALAYWDALHRPPHAWRKEEVEARQTSPR